MFSPAKIYWGCVILVLASVACAHGQGVNLAQYAPTTSSATVGAHNASRAVDTIVSDSHSWISAAGNATHRLELDLLDEYEIGSANVFLGTGDTQPVANFELQAWDDGWVAISGSQVTQNTATELQLIFSTPVLTSRVRFLSTDPGEVRVKELALFSPNGGLGYAIDQDVEIEVAVAPAATADSIYSTIHRANNATDGFVDDASRWIPVWGSATKWLQVDFGESVQIASAHLYTGAGTDATKTIDQCQLEYWDGANWVLLPETVTQNNTSFELAFTFNSTITTSMMRLVSTDTYPRIREIAFFPPNGGANYPLGTNVVIGPRPANQWATYQDNLYALASRLYGNVLDASHGELMVNTPYHDPSQQFCLLWVWDTNAFRIVNLETDLCLQVDGATTQAGAAVELGTYRGLDWQLWELAPNDDGSVKLVNVHSDLALHIADDSPAIGVRLVQQPLASNAAQDWDVLYLDHFPKKGIGLNVNKWPYYEQNITALNVNWSFNWGLNAYSFQPYGIDHMPMKWGNGASGWSDYALALPNWRGVGPPIRLQGFNEPNLASQSDVPVEDAVAAWTRLEAAKLPLVSPAPTNWNVDWLASFMGEVETQGLRVDTVAIHNYVQHTNPDAFINNIINTFNTFGRPVWVTEYAVVLWSGDTPTWTDDDVYTFLAEVLYRMELLPELERYAIFPYPNEQPSKSPSALFDTDKLTFKPVGRLFAAWDGDTQLHPELAYYLHNHDVNQRLRSTGSAIELAGLSEITESTQWYLQALDDDYYSIHSMESGQRLAVLNSQLVMASPDSTTTEVEWRLSPVEHGWYFVDHVASGKRLSSQGGVAALSSATLVGDKAQWRFIKPLDPCPVVGLDGDGDGDHDLRDIAILQSCLDGFAAECAAFDLDHNGEVSRGEIEKLDCFGFGPQ